MYIATKKMMGLDSRAGHTKRVAAAFAASVGGTPGSSASPSPANTRKSERPVMLALEASPAKRKADEFEKQNGSISSRRPEKRISGLSALDLSASLPMSSRPGLADNSPEAQKLRTNKVTESVNLPESQKSLYSLLKLEMDTLSEVLTLPGNVKAMVESFLDYVMSNHHVPQEPATILQAFQLSLCWTAASILKYKLDHKDSVSLARRCLNFGCKREDVDYVYSMLRCLKNVFLYRTGRLEAMAAPSTHVSSSERSEDAANARSSHLSWASIIRHTVTAPHLGLAQKDFAKSIQDIEKKCTKQMNKLVEKQQKEKEAIQCNYNDEKTQLENKKITEIAVIRCHRKGAMEANQLRLLEAKYAEKFDNLKSQTETRLKHLEERHVAAREQLLERKSHLIDGLRSWAQVELVNKPPETDPENAISQMSCSKNQIPEGTCLPDGQELLEDLHKGCTSTSGNAATAQVDDHNRDQRILLAVPSGNPAEISQLNSTICITNPKSPPPVPSLQNDKSVLEELKAHQSEQRDINHNCQISAEYSEVTLQVREAPLEGGETTAVAVMGDDLGRENLCVSLVSSSGCTGQANGITLEVPEVPSTRTEVANVIIDDIAGRENHGDAVVQLHCGFRRDELADMVPSQVPKVLSTLPEIATDVIVDDIAGGENNDDAVVQLHCCSNEPSDMFPSQVPEVPSKHPEITTDVIVNDITGRENNDDAVVQWPCGSRCDEVANVVLSQLPEVPSTLPEFATDVVIDVNAGRENNGDAVEQDHRGSGCDEPANIVQSQVPETSNEIVEGEINVGRVAEVSAISSGGFRVSNQSDELPSDCNLSMGHSQANSPTLLPVVAFAEENGMPSSQVLHEECDQAVQVGCDQPVQVPDARTSLNPEIGDLVIQATAAARMPATLSPDPLQNELEIIKKVKEETIKILENTKLQLKSDYEKEIEVEIVKIRKKYEVKLQEMESTVLLKTKELDAKHLKVLKNKIVAEAFNSKCTDIILGASNSTSTQEGMGASFMHQLHIASSLPSFVRFPTSLSPADPVSVPLTMPNGHHTSTQQSTISPPQRR